MTFEDLVKESLSDEDRQKVNDLADTYDRKLTDLEFGFLVAGWIANRDDQ